MWKQIQKVGTEEQQLSIALVMERKLERRKKAPPKRMELGRGQEEAEIKALLSNEDSVPWWCAECSRTLLK